MKIPYRQIDHTGDVGIEVWGDSRERLFENAALAMFDVIADLDAVRPEERQEVSVEAEDLEALLVRWLSRLNWLHITQERIFCRFEVQRLSDTALQAVIFGETIDPGRHTIYTEIKAVTYHHLRIEQTDDGWQARIIFDL